MIFNNEGNKMEDILTKTDRIRIALAFLHEARGYLRKAKCKKARRYVARAIKSTEGALRNALRFEFKERK